MRLRQGASIHNDEYVIEKRITEAIGLIDCRYLRKKISEVTSN